MIRPIAVVTGAARGLGRATAVLFAERGYGVVALDCHPEVRATFDGADTVIGVVADPVSEAGLAAAERAAAERFGRLDAAILTAGPTTDGGLSVRAAGRAVRATGGAVVVTGAAGGPLTGPVEAFAAHLARDGVRVNGLVTAHSRRRPWGGRGRWGDPAELARLAWFLATAESAPLTGVVLDPGGGPAPTRAARPLRPGFDVELAR